MARRKAKVDPRRLRSANRTRVGHSAALKVKGRAARVLAWVVYMLRCGDGSLYTGCTNDLDGRFKKHATGKGAKYTKRRLPVRLVYKEPVDDKSAALRREYALKQLTRAEKLSLVKQARGARRTLSF